MKKLLLLLTLLMGFSIHSIAQNYTEAVYLKNGSIIRGLIIEEVPNSSLKIQTSDGNIFSYTMDEIQKITKELKGNSQRYKVRNNTGNNIENKSVNKKESNRAHNKSYNPTNSLKGYKGFAETGYIFDISDTNSSHVELSTTHGYQFNNYLFVGGGAAFHYYTDADAYSAPIFASFRANFMNKKITPFAEIKSGYSIGDIEGLYATIGIGVRFALANKMALNVKLEYQYQEYNYEAYGYNGSYFSDVSDLNGVGIKCAFEF